VITGDRERSDSGAALGVIEGRLEGDEVGLLMATKNG